jgi:hypothetical protein
MSLVPDHHEAYLAAVGDDHENMVKILGYFLYRNSPVYDYDNAARFDAEMEARELLTDAIQTDQPAISEDQKDAALLASLNAHRKTQGYPPLADIKAVKKAYANDEFQKKWLAHERRKVEAALVAAHRHRLGVGA